MSNINYRADIDGLRAFAVLVVIIFHMNEDWIPGGFLGVDLFFVISGYIITSVIYPQIIANTFSFNLFYVKRIKRILPLFYLVSFTSFICAYLLYTPNDFVSFADSLRYASSFIANIYFEKQSGYFAPTSETLPLLHTWSLSIEEQFYFIWPAMLILAAKYIPKRLFVSLIAATLISLVVYSEYLSHKIPEAGYYFIQSRGFELLTGALLAILFFYKREKNISFKPSVYQLSGLTGVAIIIFFTIYLNGNSVFPGFNAFIVSAATAAIILSGESKATFTSRFLSHFTFVLLGRLSYSLYLWHWPVLAFYRYSSNSFTIRDALICSFITLVLSILSWRLFENPLRFIRLKKRWVYLFYFFLPITISVVVAKSIAKHDGYPQRFSNEALTLYQYSNMTFDHEKLSQPQIDAYPPFEPFLIGDASPANKTQIKTFIWGDSHAGHFRSYVDELGNQFGFSSLFGGLGGCPPLLGTDLIKHGKPETPCSQHNDQLSGVIKNSGASIVFLAGRWAMYTETTRAQGEKGSRVFLGDASDYSESRENSRRALKEGLERTITFLIKNGVTPVLFGQTPSYPFKPSNCWVKKASYLWLVDTNCDIEEQDMASRQGFANHLLKEVAAKYPEVILIPITDELCRNGKCVSKINGIPLYHDNNHLNSEGAREIYRISLKENKLHLLIDRLKLI